MQTAHTCISSAHPGSPSQGSALCFLCFFEFFDCATRHGDLSSQPGIRTHTPLHWKWSLQFTGPPGRSSALCFNLSSHSNHPQWVLTVHQALCTLKNVLCLSSPSLSVVATVTLPIWGTVRDRTLRLRKIQKPDHGSTWRQSLTEIGTQAGLAPGAILCDSQLLVTTVLSWFFKAVWSRRIATR